jgi:hypothetical protein
MTLLPKSRRTRWLSGIALVVLALVAAFSWVTRRRQYRTVAGAQAALDSAGLTAGAPAARVLATLDSLHAPHTAPAADGIIRARLGRSFEDFFITGDLLAEFHFDSAGRLTSQNVREILTGP